MKKALCVLGALAGGLSFSQVPEFTQQYQQRLGGAVDELAIITAEFDASAIASGLTREDALMRYDAAGDTFIADRGQSMRQTFQRYDRLRVQLAELQGANPIERVTAIGRYFDPEIARRAFEHYEPAVPVTAEGALHAGTGAAAGYGILWALLTLVLAPFRRRPRAAR